MRPGLVLEKKLWAEGYNYIAGVDEVGRGAWAGPIVAGAVAMRHSDFLKLKKEDWFGKVNDSKVLSPLTRENIFKACKKKIIWSIGVVKNTEIDSIGIAAANKKAIKLAILGLKKRPQYVLVDYVAKLGKEISDIPVRVLINGDAKVFSIALASVIAKVYRDNLMIKYDALCPDYGFGENKGYGTPKHQNSLNNLGPCGLHRLSYRPVKQSVI